MKKKILLLGSTGSIGSNTLNVVRNLKQDFDIVGLATHSNVDKLLSQIREFKSDSACLINERHKNTFKKNLPAGCASYTGMQGLLQMIRDIEADLIINSLVGAAGLLPTLEAVRAKTNVALANKESLVVAGELVMREVKNHNVDIYPIDSEHSAIWQCLAGEDHNSIKSLILTASGGPFLNRDKETFHSITIDEALNHPNWKMGKKITIDSATLMNKGFELIEAFWLFGILKEKIKVIIHPQSIVHSMIEFTDGSIKAQLGIPDMKIPIQYALTYPKRKLADINNSIIYKDMHLSFHEPDHEQFPCLNLCLQALESGGTVPAVLNASNEEAVTSFLEGRIKFAEIPVMIEEALQQHEMVNKPELDDYLEADRWARDFFKKKEVEYGY